MKSLRSSKLGIIAVLAVFGVLSFWAGDHVSINFSQTSASAAPAITDSAAPGLQAPGTGFTQIAKAVTPAVVNITAKAQPVRGRGGHDLRDQMEEFFGSPWGGPQGPHGFRQPGPPMDPREHRGGGMGSGVIVSPDGYILTNNHVMDGARELTVTLPDKREFTAKVVGTDPKTDLAVIKVDATGLPYVPWGDSSRLQVGEYVLAVGNPFGLNSTVTFGIVSALGRGRMGITQYEDFIQTDAAINPGNSGGALVNGAGELIGINTAIISQTGGYQGVGFAVPATIARPVYDSLVKTGKMVRGYLGVTIQDLTPDLAKSFGLKESKGVLVGDIAGDSPAEQGGLKQGDVIVEYQGAPVNEPAELQRAVTKTPIGSKATVKVIRDGHAKELTVTIAEQQEKVQVARADSGAAEHALAGVEVQNLDRQTARDLGLNEKVKGVAVVNVERDSWAERAGLKRGDVIREINRQPVVSTKDYEKIGDQLKKDHNVLLLINRGGASLFLTVKV
jgi:serine protease Do